MVHDPDMNYWDCFIESKPQPQTVQEDIPLPPPPPKQSEPEPTMQLTVSTSVETELEPGTKKYLPAGAVRILPSDILEGGRTLRPIKSIGKSDVIDNQQASSINHKDEAESDLRNDNEGSKPSSADETSPCSLQEKLVSGKQFLKSVSRDNGKKSPTGSGSEEIDIELTDEGLGDEIADGTDTQPKATDAYLDELQKEIEKKKKNRGNIDFSKIESSKGSNSGGNSIDDELQTKMNLRRQRVENGNLQKFENKFQKPNINSPQSPPDLPFNVNLKPKAKLEPTTTASSSLSENNANDFENKKVYQKFPLRKVNDQSQKCVDKNGPQPNELTSLFSRLSMGRQNSILEEEREPLPKTGNGLTELILSTQDTNSPSTIKPLVPKPIVKPKPVEKSISKTLPVILPDPVTNSSTSDDFKNPDQPLLTPFDSDITTTGDTSVDILLPPFPISDDSADANYDLLDLPLPPPPTSNDTETDSSNRDEIPQPPPLLPPNFLEENSAFSLDKTKAVNSENVTNDKLQPNDNPTASLPTTLLDEIIKGKVLKKAVINASQTDTKTVEFPTKTVDPLIFAMLEQIRSHVFHESDSEDENVERTKFGYDDGWEESEE